MAWPLTPLATFVDNGATPCNAAFLNAVQSAINGLYSGTLSAYGLVLDGVGGQTASPAAAQLIIGPMPALADYPLAIFKDRGGNVRTIVDHLGYRRGRSREFLIDWLDLGINGISGAASSSTGRLGWNIPTNMTATVGSFSSQLPGSAFMSIQNTVSSIANATTGRVFTAPVFCPATYSSLVLEFEMQVAVITNFDWKLALVSSAATATGTPSGSEQAFGICMSTISDTTYQVLTSNGSSFTKTNTGVTPAPSPFPVSDRFTMELHGSGSPYGAKVRVFVNDVLVIDSNIATAPTNTNANMSLMLAATSTSGTNHITTLAVTPVRMIWNAYQSLPTV